MPLSLKELQTPLTIDEVRTTLTDFLVVLGFPVTAWQDEGAARSFLEMMSALGASLSGRVATLALSVDLETAEGEFLDVKARSDYDEARDEAVATVFNADFVNSGGTTHGPIAAGQLIVRSTTGQLFDSTGIETITASATTVVELKAQVPGAAGNIGADTLQLVTPLAGVTSSTDGTLTTAGADDADDKLLRDACRTKWGTLRVEKVEDGVRNLALNAAAGVTDVDVQATNPRGPGTVDVFLAADNATAGSADVIAAQAALDLAFLGNGTVDQLVKAFAAPTTTQDITATVYVQGVTAADALIDLTAAWNAFIIDVPIGGFDLSPGPTNIIQTGQIVKAFEAVTGVISVSLVVPAADVSVAVSTKVLTGAIVITPIVVAGG